MLYPGEAVPGAHQHGPRVPAGRVRGQGVRAAETNRGGRPTQYTINMT